MRLENLARHNYLEFSHLQIDMHAVIIHKLKVSTEVQKAMCIHELIQNLTSVNSLTGT